METTTTTTKEVVVDAVPKQFWGAVKIFTEKPHVINRRICGTTNLWIGVCEEQDYSREEVLASVLKAIESGSNEEEEQVVEKSALEININLRENHINFEVDSKNDNTGTKFNAHEKEACEIQESMSETNLENDIHSKADCEKEDTRRKRIATGQKEANIENRMNLEVKSENKRGGKFSAIIRHPKLNLIPRKLRDRYFKSLSPSNTMEDDEKDENNTEHDIGIGTDHATNLQAACNTPVNDNNDNNDENGSGNNDNDKNSDDYVRATRMDHARSLPDENDTNDKNDENSTEGETGSRTGHQSALPDHQEGKLSIPWGCLTEASDTIAVVRKILPKQEDKFASVLEVILLDGARKEATYITQTKSSQPSINPKVNYTISLTSSGISLSCLPGGRQEGDPSVTWLTKNVLPKVAKWASEVSVDGVVDDRGSLKLVDVAEYNQVYQRLKMKYGKPLVKMWPEVTDPLKFVYEDIAIATYLILLWGQERQQKGLATLQSFVDLGCGNGLLVYILSGEGHRGLGVDVKRRKIWDLFPGHVELKEGVIEPSDKNLFPDYDWLIGNHSDELTPWIPVIAAKTGHDARFFIIPCCAHDFSQRYRRRRTGRSQYADYLEYVTEIGSVCGYNVKQDRLRIPSTKRICLVGSERTVDTCAYSKLSEVIDAFIKERTEATKQLSDVEKRKEDHTVGAPDGLPSTKMWTEGFKARECIQPVRNCTQLKRSVREDIISAIVGVLMEKKHLVEVNIVENKTQSTVTWDRGGSTTMGDLAKRLDRPLLAAMKRECGGLQTLLKNHRYIFNLSDGLVSLQVPEPAWKRKTTPNTFTKTKLCWFHAHHRSGCPLPSETCMFAHGEDDVRRKQDS